MIDTQTFILDRLQETCNWARSHIPFYTRMFHAFEAKMSFDIFSELPICTRADIVAAGWEARARHLKPAGRLNTSGTTGTPMVIYISSEELEVIKDFYGQLRELNAEEGDRRLTFRIGGNNHGSHIGVATPDFEIQAECTKTSFFPRSHREPLDLTDPESAANILLEHHEIPGVEPRVTRLFAGKASLAIIVRVLQWYDFPFDDIAIKNVFTTGSLLTDRFQRMMISTWGAPIHDVFSCTESMGNAIHCSICHAWHFSPEMYGEAVELVSDHKAQVETYGRLVISSMFPFRMMQPFIRYFGGDIVQVKECKCKADRLAVTFEGRFSRSAIDADGHAVATEKQIRNVLDEEARLQRTPYILSRSLQERFPFLDEVGEPQYSLDLDSDNYWTIRVHPIEAISSSPRRTSSLYDDLSSALASIGADANRIRFMSGLTE